MGVLGLNSFYCHHYRERDVKSLPGLDSLSALPVDGPTNTCAATVCDAPLPSSVVLPALVTVAGLSGLNPPIAVVNDDGWIGLTRVPDSVVFHVHYAALYQDVVRCVPFMVSRAHINSLTTFTVLTGTGRTQSSWQSWQRWCRDH
jgi:hypothetical protein